MGGTAGIPNRHNGTGTMCFSEGAGVEGSVYDCLSIIHLFNLAAPIFSPKGKILKVFLVL